MYLQTKNYHSSRGRYLSSADLDYIDVGGLHQSSLPLQVHLTHLKALKAQRRPDEAQEVHAPHLHDQR